MLFIECYDIVIGVIGWNYGLLYSGVCYVVIDNEFVCECISENCILCCIVCYCIELINGLFIILFEDDLVW